jgi:hypothetical protein
MRIVSAAVALAGGLALVAVLGACGGSPPSPPQRLSPAIVGDPLDMAKPATQPCTLARPDQLAQYHLAAPGTAVATADGPACAWTPTLAGLPSYDGGVDTHSGGLEALYHKRGKMAVFQTTTVSEYPGVHTAVSADALTHGRCTVEVGVANDTLLIVSATVPVADTLDYPSPCDAADTFAATLIGNAEGKAP